jgi:hypothetical protein
MIEDITIRHFAARTQTDYVRTVRTFAAFLGQSLDQAEPEEGGRMLSRCGHIQGVVGAQ